MTTCRKVILFAGILLPVTLVATCSYHTQVTNTILSANSSLLPNLIFYSFSILIAFCFVIGNALQYQKPNTIPDITIISALETGNYWQFSVADNGIGEEPAFFDMLFILFQRLHNRDEYTDTGTGTCIGIAVCKKIVENYNGKILIVLK